MSPWCEGKWALSAWRSHAVPSSDFNRVNSKSTLLEAIAVAAGFNAEGESRSFRFATPASHSPLHEHLRLIRSGARPKDGYFLRAESFYNVAIGG